MVVSCRVKEEVEHSACFLHSDTKKFSNGFMIINHWDLKHGLLALV